VTVRSVVGLVAAILTVVIMSSGVRTQPTEHVPLTQGAVPSLFLQLFEAQHQPFGLEAVYERENRALWDDEPADARTSVRALMTAYARQHGRFEVRDVGGLPVMRPVTAWRDPRNALNQRLAANVVASDIGWRDALEQLCAAVGAKGRMSAWREDLFLDADAIQAHDEALERHVSFGLDQPTVLQALSTLAQSHGELAWMVRYTRQRPYLMFHTRFHDGFGCALPSPGPRHEPK
jgi:hypothetical protein